MATELVMTTEGYEALKAELNELKSVTRGEISEKIRIARGFGDLSENSEYDEAKNEQGKLYSRIAELENILAGAVIINEDSITTQHVSMGTRVTVMEEGDDEPQEYSIVGSQEANPGMGRISDESPLGKALYGHGVGDEVIVEAPAGNVTYRIIAIDR